jgi:signal transduction histidine kinase
LGGAAAVCALWVGRGRGRGRALFVQIRVEDNGVGIAASKFDLLFQPFTQVRACCKGDDLSLSLV